MYSTSRNHRWEMGVLIRSVISTVRIAPSRRVLAACSVALSSAGVVGGESEVVTFQPQTIVRRGETDRSRDISNALSSQTM